MPAKRFGSSDSDESYASTPSSSLSSRSKRYAPYSFPSTVKLGTDPANTGRRPPRRSKRGESVVSSETSSSDSNVDIRKSTQAASESVPGIFRGVTISGTELRPTIAFDTFWRFAAERKAMDDRRRAGEPAPWTNDKILQKYFFCNTFRVLDKLCQYLIKEVIEKGSQDPEEVVFRVILFNLFTKIETWELLKRQLGPLTWKTYNYDKYAKVLAAAHSDGQTLYTEAFIKPAPKFGGQRNYQNHLRFLEVLMNSRLFGRLLIAPYVADVYEYLYSFPSNGGFSTYQLILNLSYTNVLNFHRDDFVMSGPGSISGLRKIFGKTWKCSATDVAFHQEVMRYLVDSQEEHFQRLGIKFSGLGPKKLRMDIADIEHTLCEVDKYCRIAHPSLKGVRTNITRVFHERPPGKATLPRAVLPKAWKHPARKQPRIREVALRLEKRYEVSHIYDHSDEGGERRYLVSWVGYTSKHDSWEFECSLLDEAPQAVEEYIAKAGITHSAKAIARPASA